MNDDSVRLLLISFLKREVTVQNKGNPFTNNKYKELEINYL